MNIYTQMKTLIEAAEAEVNAKSTQMALTKFDDFDTLNLLKLETLGLYAALENYCLLAFAMAKQEDTDSVMFYQLRYLRFKGAVEDARQAVLFASAAHAGIAAVKAQQAS